MTADETIIAGGVVALAAGALLFLRRSPVSSYSVLTPIPPNTAAIQSAVELEEKRLDAANQLFSTLAGVATSQNQSATQIELAKIQGKTQEAVAHSALETYRLQQTTSVDLANIQAKSQVDAAKAQAHAQESAGFWGFLGNVLGSIF